MRIEKFKIFIIITIIIFLINIPIIQSNELNTRRALLNRLNSLETCFNIRSYLNKQIIRISENIDSIGKKDIENVIALLEAYNKYAKTEIKTDPLDNLYKENLDELIQSAKKLFPEIDIKPPRINIIPSISTNIKDRDQNDVNQKVIYPNIPEYVENKDIIWSNKDILALLSYDVKPYEEILIGFKSSCNCDIEKKVISGSNESKLIKKINKNKPDLLLAIGMDALSSIKKIKDIPIIYLMVLNPQSVLSGEENITGVGMNIPPEKQLDIFQKALPHIKKIGLLFDPNNTGFFVKRAQDAAKKMDIELIIKRAEGSKKGASLLISMKDEIDAFWMLPDITVFSPETIEFLFNFSIYNKIPIFTFSKQFLEKGALMSLSFNAFDLGKQGGELAKLILSGKDIRNMTESEPSRTIISINSKVAKKLEIEINHDAFNEAIIIH